MKGRYRCPHALHCLVETFSLRLMENKKFWVYNTNSYRNSGFQNVNLEVFPVYGMEPGYFPVYIMEPGNFPVYWMKPGNFPV